MGCDIHAYVEMKSSNNNWRSIGGRINLGRDYNLFGYLAGVRSSVIPEVAPRGVPESMGSDAFSDYWLYIEEDEDVVLEGTVTRSQAEKYHGYNCRYMYGRDVYIQVQDEKPTWVENPDAHTASWLNAQEFEAAVLKAEKVMGVSDICKGVISMMNELHRLGNDVRIVFWFDN